MEFFKQNLINSLNWYTGGNFDKLNEALRTEIGFMIRTSKDQTKFAGEPVVRNVRIIDCIYQAGSLF